MGKRTENQMEKNMNREIQAWITSVAYMELGFQTSAIFLGGGAGQESVACGALGLQGE